VLINNEEELERIKKYLVDDYSGGISIKDAKQLLGTVQYLKNQRTPLQYSRKI